MKGRKTAVLPGIIYAAVKFRDDFEFGVEVRRYLIRGGYIKERADGSYERC